MSEKVWLIQKRGYYYRPNAQGYTTFKEEAGRYSLEELSQLFPGTTPKSGLSFLHEDVAEEYSPACDEISRLQHNDQKPKLDLTELRQAVADYMFSEGCDCCRGRDHDDHAERLGELLQVEKFSDGSGYDFSQYRSKE